MTVLAAANRADSCKVEAAFALLKASEAILKAAAAGDETALSKAIKEQTAAKVLQAAAEDLEAAARAAELELNQTRWKPWDWIGSIVETVLFLIVMILVYAYFIFALGRSMGQW